MSALPPDEPKPGEVVAGCVVERLLGRGAMGSAHLARARDGRKVVVKLLASDLSRDPELRARFLREHDALRKLPPHPHVVHVLHLDASGPRPAIVMEHVDGVPLDEAIRKHGRVPAARATRVARDLARGLAAVHACGLVHRDVKPANAMVSPDGAAKLIDFGVAKDLQRNTALTRPGELLGTAHYMAPEMWQEQAATPATDLFALGATLQQLITGRPPFDAPDVNEIADRIMSGERTPLRSLAPDAPPDLEAVIACLLEPDPANRYASAERCAADLDRLLEGRPPWLPTLLVEGGAQRLPLVGGDWFTLGSDPGAALALAHPSVAPQHAQARRDGGVWSIFDLRAPAGTFVNDARVQGAGRPLADNDLVRLGQVALRFRDPRPR